MSRIYIATSSVDSLGISGVGRHSFLVYEDTISGIIRRIDLYPTHAYGLPIILPIYNPLMLLVREVNQQDFGSIQKLEINLGARSAEGVWAIWNSVRDSVLADSSLSYDAFLLNCNTFVNTMLNAIGMSYSDIVDGYTGGDDMFDGVYGYNGIISTIYTITGASGSDIIRSVGENSTIVSNGGMDQLYGSSSNETFIISSKVQTIDGRGGFDTVDASRFVGGIHVSDWHLKGASDPMSLYFRMIDVDKIIGTKSADRLWGWSGNIDFHGMGGNDILYGGNGSDKLFGGSGNDLIYGYRPDVATANVLTNDQLYGGSGSDHIFGTEGSNIVHGDEDNDFIWANGGNDIIDGGSGNDLLNGGWGNDVLTGGEGSDVFIFDWVSWGADTISDFQCGIDTLQLNLTQFRGRISSYFETDDYVQIVISPNLNSSNQPVHNNYSTIDIYGSFSVQSDLQII